MIFKRTDKNQDEKLNFVKIRTIFFNFHSYFGIFYREENSKKLNLFYYLLRFLLI